MARATYKLMIFDVESSEITVIVQMKRYFFVDFFNLAKMRTLIKR